MSDCRETHEHRRAHKDADQICSSSSPFGDLDGTWRTLDGHSTGSGTAEHRCRVARRHSTSKTDLFKTPDSATIDYAKAFGTRTADDRRSTHCSAIQQRRHYNASAV